MAELNVTQEIARARWQEAKETLERANAVYDEYEAATKPLFDLQEAFEAEHGLIAPGLGRISTPNYFDKRKALFEANPAYLVPEEIADRLETFTDAICEAQTVLMQTPAPDLVALRWKLEHTAGACWEDGYIAQMKADIETLMVAA